MANPIKIQAEVSKIIPHGDGVYTVSFEPLKRVPKFKPGQFLHLTLDDYNPYGGFWPESRVFSIASSYYNDEIIIIYSIKGKYTTRMSKELKTGKKVWLKLPYGNFVINSSAEEKQDVILVAGGTGVSPFLSYLETELNNSSNRRINLIYGIRKKSHLLFKQLLINCLNNLTTFTLELFLEEEIDNRLFFNKIFPFSGQIAISHVLKKGKELFNPVFFLSGPLRMIKNFRKELYDHGVTEKNVKIDEWE